MCGPQQRSNAATKTYPMLEAILTVDFTAWAIIKMLWGRERWARDGGYQGNNSKF